MSRRQPGVAPYAGAILLSAFLLFAVQPMIARALLPRFGGAPAVWNLVQVFFQVLLLGGYAYSHWLTRQPPARQRLLQSLVVLTPLLLLPPVLPAVDPVLAATSPVRQVFLALSGAVGLPFLALSTNATLVQRWYLRHLAGRNPYWLYAASNGGSAAALIAYPLLIEPLAGLEAQRRQWTAGYLLYAGVTLWLLWRDARVAGRDADAPARPATASEPSWRHKLGWAARAALGSALLLSTTLQITTDVAAVPLLWTLTLLLYLVTFMLAFGWTRPAPRGLLALVSILGSSLALVALVAALKHPLGLFMTNALLVLFCGAWLCHADLARSAPEPERLSAFYLWMTVGGALGGLLSSLVAPRLFDSVAEYPASLAALVWLAALTRPPRAPLGRRGRLAASSVLGLSVLGLLWAAGGVHAPGAAALRQVALLMPLLVLVLGAIAALALKRAWLYAACLSLAAGYLVAGQGGLAQVQAQERSFFGVMRVLQSPGGERILMHGTTIHGSERVSGPRQGLPGTYYHEDGVLARLVSQVKPDGRIAVVGLGAGGLARYLRPGQTLTFYEIDPLVIRIAQERFSFLKASAGRVDLRVGDGRLGLALEAGRPAYDLLIVDAFSSDAIPTHLLTREALAVYAERVAPDGFLAFHISNHFFDLEPVIAGSVATLGLRGATIDWTPDERQRREGAERLQAVVLARRPERLALWLASPGGRALTARAIAWSDDHVDLLGALRR